MTAPPTGIAHFSHGWWRGAGPVMMTTGDGAAEWPLGGGAWATIDGSLMTRSNDLGGAGSGAGVGSGRAGAVEATAIPGELDDGEACAALAVDGACDTACGALAVDGACGAACGALVGKGVGVGVGSVIGVARSTTGGAGSGAGVASSAGARAGAEANAAAGEPRPAIVGARWSISVGCSTAEGRGAGLALAAAGSEVGFATDGEGDGTVRTGPVPGRDGSRRLRHARLHDRWLRPGRRWFTRLQLLRDLRHLLDGEPGVEAVAPGVRLLARLGANALRDLVEGERTLLHAVERDEPIALFLSFAARRRGARLRRARRRRHRRHVDARRDLRAIGVVVEVVRAEAVVERLLQRLRHRRVGAGRARRRLLAHRDDVVALLAADLEDLAAHTGVVDRILGLALIADELHARPAPSIRSSSARSSRCPARTFCIAASICAFSPGCSSSSDDSHRFTTCRF